MRLFDKLFKRTSKTDIKLEEQHSITLETKFQNAPESKHNEYDPEISQYSPLPRYYYIHGKRYDIDSAESVSNIPLCETLFDINGEKWGIDTVLREHVNRYYHKIPEKLRNACYPKISDLKWNGYLIESNAEKEAQIKQQEEIENEQNRLRQITNSDMQQFHDMPYDLSGDLKLDYRKLYIEFNKSDNDSFLNEIEKINIIIEKCSNSFLFLPNNLNLSDLNEPVLECNPYTDTGKISKYPLILHTVSLTDEERSKYYKTHHSFPDMCGCELFYLKTGLVGKANIYFHRNTLRYHFYLLYKNNELIVSKIESIDIFTNTKNLLYKQ